MQALKGDRIQRIRGGLIRLTKNGGHVEAAEEGACCSDAFGGEEAHDSKSQVDASNWPDGFW